MTRSITESECVAADAAENAVNGTRHHNLEIKDGSKLEICCETRYTGRDRMARQNRA